MKILYKLELLKIYKNQTKKTPYKSKRFLVGIISKNISVTSICQLNTMGISILVRGKLILKQEAQRTYRSPEQQ